MNVAALTARVNAAGLLPWLGGLAALLMLALLAWLAANIFWTLSAPPSLRPSAVIETDLQRVLPALTERHLFGIHQVAAAPVAPSNIRLSGVIAAQRPGHRAYALMVVEGKPAQLVREGEEIVPGVTLQRVLARQVEILRGGQPQILSLPESGKPLIEPAKGAPVTAAAPGPAPQSPRSKSRRTNQDDT